MDPDITIKPKSQHTETQPLKDQNKEVLYKVREVLCEGISVFSEWGKLLFQLAMLLA